MAKYLEHLGNQGQQHHPKQVPSVPGAEVDTAPRNVSIRIPAAFSISGSVFVFLSLGRGRWRKGNIYEHGSVFAIPFCVSVAVLSFFSLYSSCIQLQGGR